MLAHQPLIQEQVVQVQLLVFQEVQLQEPEVAVEEMHGQREDLDKGSIDVMAPPKVGHKGEPGVVVVGKREAYLW